MTGGAIPLLVFSNDVPGREWQCEPVTVGVPFPRGLLREVTRLTLIDDQALAVPLQAIPSDRWPDGTVRWALLDFQITGPFTPHRRYTLAVDGPDRAMAHPHLVISESPESIVVDTGAARFLLKRGVALPFADVNVEGVAPILGAMSGLLVTAASGERRPARVAHLTIEERGDLRTTIRLDGHVGPPRRPWLQLVIRLQFFAGSGAVRAAITLRNPRRARHRGGLWELGDRGSVFLRDGSLELRLPVKITTADFAPEREASFASLPTPMELYQDSSGGENWRHVTHVNRHGELPYTFRGYRLASSEREATGLRATPALVARHPHGSAGIAIEHFWQNCPKAIAAGPQDLIFRLFPGQFGDLHELQGGEQKTHRFTLMFGEDPGSRDARFWGRAPSSARAPASWYCGPGVMPHLSPAVEDTDDRYQRLVQSAIEGPETFEVKRERIDEYGWRNFGDIYADHENAFSGHTTPIVSHYNNQYDAVAGFAYHFMRTGDQRWHRMMHELAMHVTDIDIYHTDCDKSAYNHGLFWHTAHYVPAGRSSHRTYPRARGVNGGGPSNEHNYTAGLRLHWLLTGDRQSREAAIDLAQWVISMDDGRKTILRWLSASDTGLASYTRSPDFHGPGRGAGHSILALLDGHRLTRDGRFLAKAEQLIRRCIHPTDEITALDLLDVERRWSYTVFLQALGKYLDYKVEQGQLDRSYAYARAALVHYARWMAEHEYPYLNKPEILEYPTESWAAHEMRKCEVFLFAAGHSAGTQRDRFIERAHFFYNYSVSTLSQAETRALTRPIVLLLSNGAMALARGAADPRPAPLSDATDGFGRPATFVPQKTRAKRRLRAAAAALIMLMALAAVALG